MDRVENAVAEVKARFPGMTILENEPMSAHSSFKIGGPARVIAVPSDLTSLAKVCDIVKNNMLAPFVLGNGSNILFPDEGLNDLFIISTDKLQKLFLLDETHIYAEAGVSLAKLALFAQQNGLAGLEFASGIPGTVGGGMRMNAGAYGGELKDVTESVVCYYTPEKTLYEMDNAECRFGYRTSLFATMGGAVIMSAVFALNKGDKDEIAAKMRELNERRREKQPLEYPSAGSAFKRPEGHFAAALIDKAGLKGYSVGGAQVSEKHAGFVINKGGATSHDVYDLLMHVRNTVYQKSGVGLETEIIVLPPDYCLKDEGPKIRQPEIKDAMAADTAEE